MTDSEYLRLDQDEERVCDRASEQFAIPRQLISPRDRLIEDLNAACVRE